MPRPAAQRRVQNGLMWLVIAVSLALLTPWAIARRHSLEPRFELVAIVFGTLSCASFLVTAVMAIFARRGGMRAALFPFCVANSSLLVVATFLWARSSPVAQSYTLAAAALFMITGAVLQMRARERSESPGS
jgi:peptidoglycan/LPS O-acetylase OafA/YrhL